MKGRPRKDLIVLAADKDMEQTVMGILSRPQAMRMRSVEYAVYAHMHKDGGCRSDCDRFLRPFINQFNYAMVLFDREGSGRDADSPEEIEGEIEERLSRNGWGSRAVAVVLDPELEIWVWSDSNEVDRVCGWSNRIPSLRQWLCEAGFLEDPADKPQRPKEAFRAALKEVRKQPSSALFRQLAEAVSLQRCADRSFLKLTSHLQAWFPRDS